eukprot:11964511-Karenia_brevis.AAC.1
MGDESQDTEILQPSVRADQRYSLDDALVSHIRDAHGLSPSEYRHEVLGRALAEWPSPIPAQV